MTARLTTKSGDATRNRDIEREIDESQRREAFTLATLPDPAQFIYFEIVVTDATGGPTKAWSNGTNWLRSTDDTTVS